LHFSAYDVTATEEELLSFFIGSPVLKEMGFEDDAKSLRFSAGRLIFGTVKVNSYFASVAVDFLRRKLLERKLSFTFETVMSHPSKVELLAQAQASGFRTYLYFVATDDPAINVSRVRNRVQLGGHAVPPDRIESRYHRSLDLLMDAIRHTNRAYIFDNSTDNADGKQSWLAEITEGRKMELKTNEIPAWFGRAVLDKIK
jgi:predicted ABC-type ATPase